MNIKKAKEDIKNTVRAYLKKNDYGQYSIPSCLLYTSDAADE